MLQHDTPADFVIATGTSYSVREFVSLAFEHAGMDWKDFVDYDARYERPTEVDSLIGDASKALEELGWKAQVHVPELVRIMVDADLDMLTRED
jgi:GDPmannose 4,6-dehydratase